MWIVSNIIVNSRTEITKYVEVFAKNCRFRSRKVTILADMQKRANHETQGHGNYLIIAEISNTNPPKNLHSTKIRPF